MKRWIEEYIHAANEDTEGCTLAKALEVFASIINVLIGIAYIYNVMWLQMA